MKPLFCLLVFGIICSCSLDTDKKESKEALPRDSIALANKVTDIVAIGKVSPDSGMTELSSSVSGVITGKFFGEGDTVSKNEVLLTLKDVKQQNKLAELRVKIETQKERIRSSELELDQYIIKIADKEKTLATSAALAEEGAEAAKNVQSIQTDIALLKSNKNLGVQKIKVDQSQLKEMQTQYSAAKDDVADRILRSPSHGKMIDVDVEVGEVLQAYNPYATLIPIGHLVVWGEADELFANKMQKGQEVNIKYIGYPDTIASGHISYLSPILKSKSLFSDEPGEKQDRLVRRFKVMLDDAPDLLINAKVQCIIKLNSDVADRH